MTNQRNRRRASTALILSALLVLGAVVFSAPAPAVTPALRASSGAAVSKTKSLTRVDIASDGTVTQVDHREVSLSVSQTTNLRGRQEVNVSWSGAHPTGGLVGDLNSSAGVNQEYPFVLLECRGVDSSSVALAKQIRPETCWTQTAGERYTSTNSTAYPAWRSDAFAPPQERTAAVNAPSIADRPALCSRPSRAERWVPMVSVSGAVYRGGTFGCAGMAPEASNVGGSGLPSNATYAITGLDGKGSAQFAVWTADENATLGCTSTVKCALVAVPIMGISCDAYGTKLPQDQRPDAATGDSANTTCQAADHFRPGQIATSGDAPNPASAGALWWAASNWRNRITVPLSFAQSPNACSVVSNVAPVEIYGSILLNDLSAQWQPKFCTDDKLKPFVHVQTSDSAARTLLNAGTVDAAFSSRAPDGGFAKPTVQAPVAVTGFAVSYVIDDANGRPFTKLRLDPRLLAKLLSESYPGNALIKNNYPALSENPVNITQDPEFQALNPGLPKYLNQEAAATLLSLSSDADMTHALTSYIDADPEARGWLNGVPDPWGMKVNPKYKGIDLPVDSWPLLDDTLAPKSYIDGGNNPCYSYSPTPYLGLIANPTAFISTVELNMQYAISNVNLICNSTDPHDVSSLRLQIQGRQQPGFRFVLGVVPLSAVSRYSLNAAALQAGPGGDSLENERAAGALPVTKRAYVSATDTGLEAAAKLFTADKVGKTWSVDYTALGSKSGTKAYPGAVPVYLDAPTTGLNKAVAARLAQFLRYAAGPGQVAGLANGELPPGYLPLTKANGLSGFADYTLRAAAAIEEQKALVPSLDPKDDVTAVPTTPTGSGPLPVPPPNPAGAGSPSGGGTPAPVATAPLQSVALTTSGAHSAFGDYAFPVLLILGLLLGLAGLGLRWGTELGALTAPVLGDLRKRVRR